MFLVLAAAFPLTPPVSLDRLAFLICSLNIEFWVQAFFAIHLPL